MSSAVNRKVLDFDFEKICSVTLSTVNVYVCLGCGKYFQGRNEGTPAYMHALHHEEHRLHMSLSTLKVYSLPDNVEFSSESNVIAPLFNPQILAQIDANVQLFQDLHGKLYLPGYCGLNNVKANDYINVVVQCLAHILPLRNAFLLQNCSPSSDGSKGELSAAWTELLRKLWNPQRFKAQNSPHEFLQTVNQVSAKRFSLTAQADPGDFMTWFLNALEAENAGCLSPVLRGSVRIETAQLNRDGAVVSTCAQEKSFLHLSLDLPTRPLFSDPKAPAAVPQVSLSTLLSKFDGGTPIFKQNAAITYQLTGLPPFLVLYVTRRVKGRFGVEWNDTLVRFNAEEVIEMPGHPEAKYRLMANIYCRRSGDGEAKSFGVHLRHGGSGKWLEMENLQVKEAESQLLFMAESLIQFWERLHE